MNDTPIGILDSGFGGLSIYQSIRELLPLEPTVYIGDHAHIPYSSKTPAHIKERVKSIIHFLINEKAKLIVVACNTATVAGIDVYRNTFPGVPIVGVVPVVKTAAETSRKKSFAVLSTPFTAKSKYQKALIARFAGNCRVYNLGGHSLVDLVEKGIVDGFGVEYALRRILTSSMLEHIDVVALGCTHYPFLKAAIRAIVGENLSILDSGGAVARQVKRILEHNNLRNRALPAGHVFFSTRKERDLSRVASKLLGEKTVIRYAPI